MKLAKIALFSLALGASSHSYAAKIFTMTNTITPDSNGSASLYGGYGVSGSYRYSIGLILNLSQPVTGTFTQYNSYRYSINDKDTGQQYEGNSNSFADLITLTNSSRYVAKASGSPTPWTGCYFGRCNNILATSQGIDFSDFSFSSLTGPVTMTVSGFQAVPEPATWSMMILGFGAIGAMVRRRGKVSTGSLALC